MKKEVPHDKYFLRSLHQEIDLYDRKLAYLEKYGEFPSLADREGAENKLLAKRASLAETAKRLVADGVEFNAADLPVLSALRKVRSPIIDTGSISNGIGLALPLKLRWAPRNSLQGEAMNIHSKTNFNPLCDLHHSPMRHVMLEGSALEEAESFHQCERRDCNRIFRDGYGYSDFGLGEFDASRVSSRQCPTCGGTLYLAEVDHTRKVETWDCTEVECDHTEEVASPSGR